MIIDWNELGKDLRDFTNFLGRALIQTLIFGILFVIGFVIPTILFVKGYVFWMWIYLVIVGVVALIGTLYLFYGEEEK